MSLNRNQKTARNYLESYSGKIQALKTINAMLEELDDDYLVSRGQKVKVQGSKMYQGEAAIVAAIDRKVELKNKSIIINDECRKIESLIITSCTEIEVAVLLRWYAFNLLPKEIANEMHYSERHIWRIYDSGINKIGRKCQTLQRS